jgi:hypothetical protein
MKFNKPNDWNNHNEWEKFFSSLYPNGEFTDECFWIGSISLDRLEDVSKGLKKDGVKKVWFPGCGISLLPKALSQRGFKVYATDISATAIDFQNSDDPKIQELIDKSINSDIDQSGFIQAEIQDFRLPYKKNFFDLIINTKAFQGFNKETMSVVAKNHFDALKHSGQAIFDTVNVQGELRELFELSLADAGFIIPFYEINCWFRNKLRETNIPYAFILGRPMPFGENYKFGSAKRDKAMKIFGEISEEFQQKQKETLEIEQEKLNNLNAKIASIIYSTG